MPVPRLKEATYALGDRYWTSLASVETLICPRFFGVGVLESGGVVVGVLAFVFGRGEHLQRAVSAAGVVEELDVVVDRGRELDPRLPGLAVEQLDLHAAPERFDHG